MNQTREEYAYEQESNGLAVLKWAVCAIAFWGFLLLLSSLFGLAFSSCQSSKPAPVRKPVLGLLQDKEVPTPKYSWYPSDARP